jgi:hypothetical protein
MVSFFTEALKTSKSRNTEDTEEAQRATENPLKS